MHIMISHNTIFIRPVNINQCSETIYLHEKCKVRQLTNNEKYHNSFRGHAVNVQNSSEFISHSNEVSGIDAGVTCSHAE